MKLQNSKSKSFWFLRMAKNYWWFLKSLVKGIFKKKKIEIPYAESKKVSLPSFESMDKYLTVSIENNSNKKEVVNLFSMNNLSLPDHLKIKIHEAYYGLHDELIKIKEGNKYINGLRYCVSNRDQLNNSLMFTKYSGFGYIQSVEFRPLAFMTSYQQQALQIDAPGYKFMLNSGTIIDVPINPNEKITLLFQICDIPNENELTTGLVQVIKK
jgi:hypothetical protein